MSGTFEDDIAELADRSREAVEKDFHEAQTVLTLILPFIKALGYDVFSFKDVGAEFKADTGGQNRKKVDFMLKIDGEPVVFIEAKRANKKLGKEDENQLYKYFSSENRKNVKKIAVLTNGKEAWFYGDTDGDKIMDEEPFLRFNFQNPENDHIIMLKELQKDDFNIDKIIELAKVLKYSEKRKEYFGDKNSGDTKSANSIVIAEPKISAPRANEFLPKQNVNKKIRPMESPATLDTEKGFRERYKNVIFGYEKWIAPYGEPSKSFFLRYLKLIYNNFENVGEKDLQTCIKFFAGDKAFASILLLKENLQIGLQMNMSEVNDPDGICDSWKSDYLGVGPVHFEVNKNSTIGYALALIQQAYDKANNSAKFNRNTQILNQQPIRKLDSAVLLPMTSESRGFEEKYKRLGEGSDDNYAPISKKPNRTIFLNYIEMIHGLGAIGEKVSKTCVKFSIGSQTYDQKNRFISIAPWQNYLKIGLDIDIKEINDPEKLCEDRSTVGYNGIGNTFVDIPYNRNHNAVFELIQQVHRKHKQS